MKRCFKCRKKSTAVTKCKCNNHYCLKHLYPDDHNCIKAEDIKKKSKQKLKDQLINASTINKKKIKKI